MSLKFQLTMSRTSTLSYILPMISHNCAGLSPLWPPNSRTSHPQALRLSRYRVARRTERITILSVNRHCCSHPQFPAIRTTRFAPVRAAAGVAQRHPCNPEPAAPPVTRLAHPPKPLHNLVKTLVNTCRLSPISRELSQTLVRPPLRWRTRPIPKIHKIP